MQNPDPAHAAVVLAGGGELGIAWQSGLLAGLLDEGVDLRSATTVVGTSAVQQGRTVPEKILESTINIPPLLTQTQGALVGVYIARDIDFSSVYALRASDASPPSNR